MTLPFSYLNTLTCSQCGQAYEPAHLQRFCAACSAPLLAEYDLTRARAELDRDALAFGPASLAGMWRFHALLPVHQPGSVITLGEGSSPTLRLERLGAHLRLPGLYLKDESLNPTATFKARGLSAAISKAKELGVQKVVIPTAGNAGGAMAAYASRAGMAAVVYMPADTPPANILECQIAGAETVLVPGLISDAAVLARQKAEQEGYFDLSTFKEPYRVEGKKIMGYEIAAFFGWRMPDVILYPTGGGTGLVGIWKAFQELRALGWLESARPPRMVAVQAAGCAPVVRAFAAGSPGAQFWQGASTHAAGLRVPKPFGDRLILSALRESGGTATAVSEQAIREAQLRLAREEGIFAAPEGAALLAGLEDLLQTGWVERGEEVLLLNTGSGLKYLDQHPL